MSQPNESPYTAQKKHRIVRQQSNQDPSSLLSDFIRDRGQFRSFTRRQMDEVVAEATVEPPAALAVPDVQPAVRLETRLSDIAHLIPMGLPVARVMPRLAAKPSAPTSIAVFSPAGGVGKSTMTAAIGSILCQHSKRVLLFDASTWQSVAFHFGAKETKTRPSTFFAPGLKERSLTVFPCAEGDALLSAADEVTASESFEYVLFDLSSTSGEKLLRILSRCAIVLIPLLPDAFAIRSVAAVRSLVDSLGAAAPIMRFVLNRMDDSESAREVAELLSDSLGDLLFPSFILHQPEVPKALAEGIVIPSFAPEAQATVVFEEIAEWILKPGNAASKARKWSER